MKLARFLLVLFWCWPLTVSGQESAISGVWELHSEDGFGSVSLRLQTSADGSLSLKAAGRAGPELLDLVGDELAFLPDSLVAAVDGAGTWRADGDSLRISWSQLDIAVNGVPLSRFIDALVADLADSLADDFQLEEEVLEAFRESVASMLLGQLSGLLLLDDSVAARFSVEEDRLTLTTSDGSVTLYRAGGDSAVRELSWGYVKSAR